MLVLYDLVGAAADCRFSPYCWRSKLALALKGLAFETVPVRFTDKPLIAFSGQDKVPVLTDGDAVVSDSSAIVAHLERTYPETPLVGSGPAVALTAFVQHWTERVLHVRLMPLIVLDVHARLAPADQAYFRQAREARFGRTLEEVAADPAGAQGRLHDALAPLRATLRGQAFLAGPAPAYADCIVFGAFQWARVTRPHDLLAPDDPIFAWRDRMLDLAGGLARATPAAEG